MSTPGQGANGYGAMYRITLSGQAIIIYSYAKGTGAKPGQFVQGSDGNFYGTTDGDHGVGEIYQLTPSGQYTTLHTMRGNDGLCGCSILQGSDGVFYGVAVGGGSNGAGTIWALNAGLPKPAPQALAFQPSSGPAGTEVQIWGYNLLDASVDFHGRRGRAHSSGPNYIIATVPPDAKSGKITVTTPGGTTTTSASFTVN
jgi:uncharacterized repeat protein (TIGR03803 family)